MPLWMVELDGGIVLRVPHGRRTLARCVADRLRRAKCVTLHPNQGALNLNRLVSVVRDSNRYLSRRVDLSGKSELFRHRQGACDNPELSRRVTPVVCRRYCTALAVFSRNIPIRPRS